MDIWIKDQDNEGFIKVNEVEYQTTGNRDPLGVIFEKGHFIMACNSSYRGFQLGQYTTKERALEVLEEVWMFMKNGQKLFIKNTGPHYLKQKELKEAKMQLDECGIVSGSCELEAINQDIFYEMPKE